MANREDFGYPPFAKFIKLSYRHSSNDKAYREAFILRQKLTQAIGLNPAFISKEKGKYIWNIILKIKPGDDKNVLLDLVPPGWTIDVDPKNII